ncbi:MAG: hypothetical protein NVSMB25_20140 [Thermoleophilaceae bacterium]
MGRHTTTEERDERSRTVRLGEPTSASAVTVADGPGTYPTPPAARVVLGRYRLERRLGAGGFGVVWLAFDEKLEREVAVKVIPRDGDEPVPARAEREARVAARLNHPGIVALYELASDDEAVYLVSELVQGRTLAELGAARALSDRDIARIGVALCDALAHAHERRVIHRDVKPQNVIVAAEPAAGAGFAKLADFGVAHLSSGDPLTGTGDVVGTLAYMAPEQAEGQRVTAAADVYALALTLYESWTGSNPVRAGGAVATARRLGTALPLLGDRRRDLPQFLARTIDAALVPNPERRPSLRALRVALEDAVEDLSDSGGLVEPATLERVGLPPAPRRPRRRRIAPPRGAPLLARAAAGAAGAASLAAAIALIGAPPPAPVAALAATTGCAVAAFPRAAWLLAASALAAWAALGADLGGIALIVLCAAALVAVLLPRAGVLWSLPVLAPLLGVLALAPVFVAISGFASTAARRAGLAAAGFAWIALAEALGGRRLMFGASHATLPRHLWTHSLAGAGEHALGPLVTTPALAPMVAWGLLAALLPLFVRGRVLALDIFGACVWAGALFAAQRALGRLILPGAHAVDPHGALLGVALAGVAAVALAAAAPRRAPADPLEVP